MGGYGSGGHNRTHDYTSRYRRLDSFIYGKGVPLLLKYGKKYIETCVSWTDGSSIGTVLFSDKLIARYTAGEEKITDTFYFERVPNNYGGAERVYFTCPYCSDRVRILYMQGKHFKCRKCAGLNYYSQQMGKDTDIKSRRMGNFIRDKFRVTKPLAPIEALCCTPDRPKGMHMRTYNTLLAKLRRLQEEYNREYTEKVSKIYGRLGKVFGNIMPV